MEYFANLGSHVTHQVHKVIHRNFAAFQLMSGVVVVTFGNEHLHEDGSESLEVDACVYSGLGHDRAHGMRQYAADVETHRFIRGRHETT